MKDKIIGKAEELWGRMSGDRALEIKGRGRQTVGEVKRVGKEIVYDAEHRREPEPRQPADRTRP